jgi:hypothetical protein
VWIIFFGGLACWHGVLRNNASLGIALLLVALVVGPIGLLRPKAVRLLYCGAMILSFPIGWLMSRFVLASLFYLVFTPIGFLFRLLGRDPLQRTYQTEETTYWEPKPVARGKQDYLRQF